MGQAERLQPQRIRVSSKRQITIPAKAYRELGFKEYALIEQTDEGLLIKPLEVANEHASLEILRGLVEEGLEGEELLARYAEACERVVDFNSCRSVRDGLAPGRVPAEGAGSGEQLGEQQAVAEAVAHESAQYPAITRAYVFGSFARGDYGPESDVDVRLEYDDRGRFTLFEVAQFQKHLERATGREVDVITACHLKNKALEAAIEREKVLVYERKDK